MWHNGDVGMALVTRSGSHTLFKQILKYQYPENNQSEENKSSYDQTIWHPVKNLSNLYDLKCDNFVLNKEFAVMVRNPLERFRSACARKQCSPIGGLTTMQEDVHFWSIHSMGLIVTTAKFFLFPCQLKDCMNYLNLPTNLEKLNGESDDKKPNLNQEEAELFQAIYEKDIELYNNVKEKCHGRF